MYDEVSMSTNMNNGNKCVILNSKYQGDKVLPLVILFLA